MDETDVAALLDPASMDPTRTYRWASTQYQFMACSAEDYQIRGWTVETWRENGPRPLVMTFNSKPVNGDPIERPGLVLVSMDKAQERATWHAGQAQVEARESFIKNGSEFGAGNFAGHKVQAEIHGARKAAVSDLHYEGPDPDPGFEQPSGE
jgi:hypothetical protein